MTALSMTYRDKVLIHLINDIKEGETFKPNVKNDSYPQYIQAVKTIIDCRHDIVNGFTLTFNDDYTRLTKEKYIKK